MPRGCSQRRGTLLLLLALSTGPLRAHEEWNNLHIVYSANTQFTYPFDGRSPKIAAALLNHHNTFAPATRFTFTVNGQPATGFTTFPDGSDIVIPPDEYGIASASTAGVYEGRVGPAPAVGETKEYTFQWVFALAPGAVAPPGSTTSTNPDPENNGDVPGITTARVRFTNLGDNPTLSGPLAIGGTLRLAPPETPPVVPISITPRVEVATPHSPWFPVAVASVAGGPGTSAHTFQQALPARNDWFVRISANGYETRVIPVGFINDTRPPIDLVLYPAPAPGVDYRRIATITTPTGFWRGAVAESEGTFVAFPGQENWKSTTTDADHRALRAGARLYKYKFDGTKLWEHAPGWETWGGDMTADGRFVAYVLNPTVRPFYTPTENKLVLLDGATGAIVWSKSAAPSDATLGRKLDSLELTFSPDARWIAVGSVGTGQVTLFDRATGTAAWSAPGSGPSFGQVRKLRFSPDGQFLYCGSGDGQLRKLRTSDGVVLWKNFVGGWPYVNGIDLTPDGAWLAAGTKSLDTSLLRTSDGRLEWQRESQHVDAVFAPDGRHFITAGGQVYRTLDGVLTGMTTSAALTRFTPDSRHLVQLERGLRLYDLGGKLLRSIDGADTGAAAIEQTHWVHLSRDGRYAIVLGRDMANPPQAGIALYERRAVNSTDVAPAFAAQPLTQTVTTGTSTTLAVEATGTGPLSFQWRKNGTALAGQNAASLALSRTSAADAGVYDCVVTNAVGAATSSAATVAVIAPDPTNPSRLANLAVRATVGGVPLIVGFAVGGEATAGAKTLLIRGAGPSLGAVGVTGALPDPRLSLFDGTTSVATNDNWAGDADVSAMAARVGAFPFSGGASRDAALAAIAVRGSYTVQLVSADAASGTALAEIYDGTTTFAASTPRLVNVSARHNVTDGAGVLIAGFVIMGPTSRTVLIRAVGPGLKQFGVANALNDTQLALFSGSTQLAANNNWYDASNALAVIAAATQVGAFALPQDSLDGALLLSLPPGSYTAQVRGAAGTSGNALIEVYEVP